MISHKAEDMSKEGEMQSGEKMRKESVRKTMARIEAMAAYGTKQS